MHNKIEISTASDRSIDGEPAADRSDYPRTLIVGGFLSQGYGTGIYLTRIFSSWPTENLACADRNTFTPEFARCTRYYRLGTHEICPPPLVAPLLQVIQSGPVTKPTGASAAGKAVSETCQRSSRLIQLRARVRSLLGGGDILYRPRVSRELIEWIQDFRPEIIYGQCATLTGAQFLRRIKEATGLPLVIHCMDDFAEGHYRNGWGKALDGYLYRREFNRLMQSASGVIAICKEMALEYQARYGRPVAWIDMPADVSAYEAVRRRTWRRGKEFRIRYGGRVGWGIRTCLAEFAMAVQQLRQEGHPVFFDIVRTNTADVPESCLCADGVQVLAPEPLDQVPKALAKADALLVCYDFDGLSFRQARFSMPSKLPECMASGTPVIVYAPAGLPVVEYARRRSWGAVIDSNNIQTVKNALREFMHSNSAREELARTAAELASLSHSADAVSRQLYDILNRYRARNTQ